MAQTANAWNEAQALVAAVNPDFEREHPRGGDGKFIPKIGGWVRFLDINAGAWVKAEVMSEISKDGKFKVKSIADGTEQMKPRKELFWVPQPKAFLKPSSLKKSSDQSRSGSNVGQTMEDDDGSMWYVKTPTSKMHAANENFANRMYVEAGAAAPITANSPDGKNFLTKIEKSKDWHEVYRDDDRKEAMLEAVARDFVIDAWLANWDAPVNDNLRITEDGTPLRVDAGGAVMFRARGGIRNLTPSVTELQSMRDPSVSSDGARAYSKVTKEYEIDAAKRILAISPERIKELALEDGLPANVADDLITRRAFIATHYGLVLPETTKEGREAFRALESIKNEGPAAEVAKKAAVKAVVRLAPDSAAQLAPGSPVWVKDKNDPHITTDGRIQDVMIVQSIPTDEDDYSKHNFLWLKSRDGKVSAGNVPASAVEPLRDNFASESSIYKTGERPQIGDHVEGSGGVKGVLVEMYPLYAKLKLDDGTGSKVIRVKTAKLLAKSGTHDAAKITDEGFILDIGDDDVDHNSDFGPLADVINPVAKFPLLAYSLPHRAKVLVLDYDGETEKATVMLGDYRRVVIPAGKLYDIDKIDFAKVDAMPVRGPRATRIPNDAPREFQKFDTSKLPIKTAWQVNKNVVIEEFHPGDRLIKAKNNETNQINFFRIYTNNGARRIEYVGGSKSSRRHTDTTSFSDNTVLPVYQNDPQWIWSQIKQSKLTDATPAKYDQAAWEEEDEKPHDFSNLLQGEYKISVSGRKHPEEGSWDPETSYSRASEESGKSWELSLKAVPGIEYQTVPDPNGRLLGVFLNPVRSYYRGKIRLGPNGRAAHEFRQMRVPRLVVKKDGKHFDTGPGGKNLDFESNWEEIDAIEWKKYEAIAKDYWSPYSDTAPDQVTLPWGTVDRIDIAKVPGGQGVDQANSRAKAVVALQGLTPADEQNSSWLDYLTGSENIFNVLARSEGWNNGSLSEKLAQHQANEDTRLKRIAAAKYQTGHVITKQEELGELLPGTLIVTELNAAGRQLLADANYEGDASKVTEEEAISYKIKATMGLWFKAEQKSDGEWQALFISSNGNSPIDGLRNDQVGIPTSKHGTLTVEKLPGITASADGTVPDVDTITGFDALTHKLDTDRDRVNDGKFDDQFDKIMRTDFDSTLGSYGSMPKISDGTSHGDPRMAQFVLDHGGTKKTLVVPPAVFKIIIETTGANPNNWRFVASADQRDAIKYGDHFNGTGVSGNGVYSGPKSAANGYGSAGAQITMRPGGRAIENGEASLGVGEDIAFAAAQRADLLAESTHLPSMEEILSLDPALSTDSSEVVKQLEAGMKLSDPFNSWTDEQWKDFYGLASTKAAIAYTAAMKQHLDKGQWDVSISKPIGYYRYSDSSEIHVKVVSRVGDEFTLRFNNPETPGTSGWGRQQASRIDKNKLFWMKTEWNKKRTDAPLVKDRRTYGSYGAGGTFFDDTTDILSNSGLAEAMTIPGRQTDLTANLLKARRIDSRISFISDPGRWAVAAGYDNLTVPGSDFNIFLHRTAFIVRK